LTVALREVDTPSRSGGEEFAILLPQTPKQGALVVAERMAAWCGGTTSSSTTVGQRHRQHRPRREP
jgi:PleD family two-component response regulator